MHYVKCMDVYNYVYVACYSLNYLVRENEQDKIATQNMSMAKRLGAIKPIYAANRWVCCFRPIMSAYQSYMNAFLRLVYYGLCKQCEK